MNCLPSPALPPRPWRASPRSASNTPPSSGLKVIADRRATFRVPSTAASSKAVFEQAVVGASDAPKQPIAAALGRLLYLVHLAVLLWWLLDKSANQRATATLVSLTQQLLPSA